MFPLRAKSDVFQCLQHFHAYVSTQFQLPLIALQADNGKEFDNSALCTHLASYGVALRLSCPYTSSQNGKAERILRTLNDCVRSLLIHAGMPFAYWVEALATATHLLNRRHCQTSGTVTPFELLLGAPPDYTHLRVFGCLCFPNQASTQQHKLAPRSTPCALLGYPADHRGYRCLDLSTRRVITSRHVVFDETQFPFISRCSAPELATARQATVPDGAILIQSPVPCPPQPSPPPPHSPPANPSPPHSSQPPSTSAQPSVQPGAATVTQAVHHPMITRAQVGIHKPNPRYTLTSSTPTISPIPASARAALKDPNWCQAMALLTVKTLIL